MTVFLETTGVNQMMYMMDEEKMLTDADRKIVSDGQTAHKNIFELEKQFTNAGHSQGSKFSMEQRIKTMGY
jgi:predicted RNA binding protein with dsRBD fold (UPF0201 family)